MGTPVNIHRNGSSESHNRERVMKLATVTVRGISPYSQSKYHRTPKLEKESHADYENRTWRERMHYDSNGIIFIPGMQFKRALDGAAGFLGMKIPGRGSSMFKKHLIAGVMVLENMTLGIHKDEVQGETLLVSSNGRKGGGSSVEKTFGRIPEGWRGEITFHVFDDTVTKEVFEKHITEAGKFIGIGRFRPENGGYYGRFAVESITWEDC